MKKQVRGALAGKMRLPLPSVVDPPKRRCVTIEIPDQYEHFAAFWGWLWGLTRWYTWQTDPNKTGKELAAVYLEVYDKARERFALGEDSCVGCAHVNQGFFPPLEPGETRTMRVTVEAGEFNILPIVLFARQSLTLSDFKGQWRDSQYHPDMECTSNWETPGGIVINAGGGASADTFVTDVMPDVPHMKLIMRVNACDVLSYHDIEDPITYTVPASAPTEGVFVEFLGNCPVDINNEIASGFLGYGMVCLTAIVSDENFCPQVFIDFEEDPPTTYELINGTIVPTSPIGEGAACRGDSISAVSKQVEILIPTEDCTARDYAFTFLVENSSPPAGMHTTWFLRRENGTVIASGNQNIPFENGEVGTMTVELGSAPGVFSVELQWICTTSGPIDPNFNLYIDNVFLN